MTIGDALEHAGIKAEKIGVDEFVGTTKSGKKFYMRRACGAYGLQFTLDIDGINRATHCAFRTAVKKIKTN